jgi:hypothetical protein
MCHLAHCRAGAEHLETVCPSFNARFLDEDVSIRLHSTVYGTTLLKIVNHDYPLTIPKNEAIIFPADGTLLNNCKEVSQGCSTACSVVVVFFLDQSDVPMLHPVLQSGR